MKEFKLEAVKKYWWLGLVLLLVPVAVRADGMIIPYPGRLISESGQKAVIWHDGKTETLIVSTTFRGDAADFAWVIPVPSKPEVTQAKDELFTALRDLTAPKYPDRYPVPLMGGVNMMGAEDRAAPSVTVVETKKIDIYDVAVLEANNAGALEKWLIDNGYEYPTNRDLLLKYYINKNWYFVAAKVSGEAMGYVDSYLANGHATPLSIKFDSPTIVYPLKISGPGSKFNEDVLVGAFGFEQGVEGWSGGAVEYDQAWQGQKSFKAAIPSLGTATRGNNLTHRDVMGLKQGTDYVLSAYVKATASASLQVKLRVSGQGVEEMSRPVELQGTSDWKRLELKFKPTASAKLVMNLMADGPSGQVVYWDGVQLEQGTSATDFKVEKIPEQTPKTVSSNEYVPIELYVFSDHKKSSGGFTVGYAGWVQTKVISNLAVNDDGEPWITNNKKMYLTKLTRNMMQSEMTDDLVIRDAADNTTVGGTGGIFLDEPWKVGLVLGVPIVLEIIGIIYFWRAKWKA